MMINACVNAKNEFINVYVVKDLLGILVICECECDKSCDVGE